MLSADQTAITTEQMCNLLSTILSLMTLIGFAVFWLQLSHATFLHIAWGQVKIVFLSAFLTEPCHSKNCFIHDHICTIKKINNFLDYTSVSNLKYMFFNIKYRMYFKTLLYSKMMDTSSPVMNVLNIHIHILSCAGPPRTVQNLRQVKICRQLTKRAYHVS